MKLLVTGASGFLGRRVVRHALARGHHVTGLARCNHAESIVRGLGADVVSGDLDDPESVDRAFQAAGSDALLNIASLGFGHAETIIAAAERAGLRRAVLVSTTGIFTTLDPPSKQVRLAAEEAVRSSDLDWTIIRPTMIYGGPDDRNMSRLLTWLQRFPALPVPGGGRHLQQPVHVDDLADVIVSTVSADISRRRSYNIAGPETMTFLEIAEAAGAAIGRRTMCLPIPTRPVHTLVRMYERRVERPRLRSEQITRLTEDKAFDIGDARRDLGFAPRSFNDGILDEARLMGLSADGPRGSRQRREDHEVIARPRNGGPIGALVSDLRGVADAAGTGTATRFLGAVAAHAPTVLRTGTLTAADAAMAGRAYRFRPLEGVEIVLPGDTFGGAREMYCRQVYFALPGFAPAAGEVVVDLGANQGLFSVVAARAGADVIAVEAQRGIAARFMRHAEINGVTNRIQLLHALIGSATGVFSEPNARHAADHWDGEVERLTLREVLQRGGVDQANLVKMDIEGSEFALFSEPDWLHSVGRIVMEVHTEFGEPESLMTTLRSHGFETTLLSNGLQPTVSLGTAPAGYLYARRRPSIPSPRTATALTHRAPS